MKILRWPKILPCVLLLPAIFLTSCGPDTKTELTKEDIIQKAWTAMFGELKNEDVKSLYAETLSQTEMRLRMMVERPNRFRNEVPDGILVFDGRRAAWVMRAPDEKGNPREPELIEPESWKHFEIDIALLFSAFFDFPSELLGRAAVNGTDAHKIQVNLPLGGIMTYFVDADSFLITKRLVNWNGVLGQDWENLLDDYIQYDGFRFPGGYRFQGRDGMAHTAYQNVKINVNPSEEMFKIPDDLK